MKAYENKTKTDLLMHPLASQLQSCNSTSDILAMLLDKVNDFDKSRSHNKRLSSWLNPTINVLYAFSTTLVQGVGLVSLDFYLFNRPPPKFFHRYSCLQMLSVLESVFSFWSVLLRLLCRDVFNDTCQAAKDVGASEEALAKLFERIENFFKHLESYTEVPPTNAMTDVIVKIMVEVLNIFTIAMKEIKQGQASA
jgi:hypothetical protein